MSKKVSVIIPTYNREKELMQSIKTVMETKERIPYRGNLKYIGNGRINIPSQYIISPNDPRYGHFKVGESLLFIFEALHK